MKKNKLAVTLGGIVFSAFASNAFADHHEGHAPTTPVNPTTATTMTEPEKDLRANTTDKHGNVVRDKKAKRDMHHKGKKAGLKPLSPKDEREMINREKTASPPAENISDSPDVR